MTKQYIGRPPAKDDWGSPITTAFIDGRTIWGPWAIFTPRHWALYGLAQPLGTGVGQRYNKNPDGRWIKQDQPS
jgi:hypothetical protein